MNERKLKVSKDIESEIEKVVNKLCEVDHSDEYKTLCSLLNELLSMHNKIGNSYFVEIEDLKNNERNNRKFRFLKDSIYYLYKSSLKTIKVELDNLNKNLNQLLEEDKIQRYKKCLLAYKELVNVFERLDNECANTEKNREIYKTLVK